MDKERILQEVERVKLWYHSIDLGACVTPGMVPLEQEMARVKFMPESFKGQSVLDIGAWDGFYSFEAEKRGAKTVVAMDSFAFGAEGKLAGVEKYKYQGIHGFNVAKDILKSKVNYWIMDLYDLPKRYETFDVVMFFEMITHLPDPISALDIVCRKCKNTLLIEADLIMSNMAFMAPEEKNGDATKNWRLSFGLLTEMLNERGFPVVVVKNIEHTSYLVMGKLNGTNESVMAFNTGRYFIECRRE